MSFILQILDKQFLLRNLYHSKVMILKTNFCIKSLFGDQLTTNVS
ncbi:hypothetical protein LEP1GSC172_3975 [Leptospira noguchii]|uniref:Uncharacterized protein n=2 Tax=Leptospira noguchii TaxID=28182 RepID=T0FJ59_9LEPT|nr:hypothetical protein LEP1GSC172_3975 [Leptospira noguchii]EQA73433.1 hypothetical protein LEP1GSC059_0289 [Leptospira noguchii serovar Panama str. CZ214]